MPAGSFVCEYAGECLTAAEATRRLGEYDCAGIGHALLVKTLSKDHAIACRVTLAAAADLSCSNMLAARHAGPLCCSDLQVARETLPSGEAHMRLNVDATRSGNVARFFSHR